MRWVTAGGALAITVLGIAIVLAALHGFFDENKNVRSDESDVMLLIGSSAVVLGLFVLTVLAVST